MAKRKTFCTDVSNLSPERRKEFAKILKKTTEDFNEKISEEDHDSFDREREEPEPEAAVGDNE